MKTEITSKYRMVIEIYAVVQYNLHVIHRLLDFLVALFVFVDLVSIMGDYLLVGDHYAPQ